MAAELVARLDKTWARVLCGWPSCRGELGRRGCAETWIDNDGRRYRSPYYVVTLSKGYHHYGEDVYHLTPRAKERLAEGRRPTYRKGGAGPSVAGTYVTGHLSPFNVPPEGSAKVDCPRCIRRSTLTPEALHLVDWEDRDDGFTIALPP